MTSLMKKLLMGLGIFTLMAGAGLPASSKMETAILAGGCFWCMTPPFEKLDGVIGPVISGYIDGKGDNPTYQDYEDRGFVEVVKVTYDPSKITYEKLLDVFWHQINPTDGGGQFVDRGPQYRPVIFYQNAKQKKLAEKSRDVLLKSGKFGPIIFTEIKAAPPFWAAEEYHQDYYKKNPVRYHFYRHNAGRDQYLDRIWGKGNH